MPEMYCVHYVYIKKTTMFLISGAGSGGANHLCCWRDLLISSSTTASPFFAITIGMT